MKNQILILGGFFLGLIGLVVFFLILFKIINKTRMSNPINPLFFLFGFLLTSYFYPSGFKGMINLVRGFFLESYLIIQTNNSNEIFKLIGSVFDSQLWYDSMTFVSLFLIISFLVAGIKELLTKHSSDENSGIQTMNNIRVKNLIVASVLILALYFSISSIIAVPIVSYQSSEDIKLSIELEEELSSYSINDSLLNHDYIEFIHKKENLFEKNSNNIELVSFIRNYFLTSLKEIKTVFREIEQLENRAVQRMKITDNSNINPRLRLKDKSELSSWYLENRSKLLEHLNNQQNLINIFSNELFKRSNPSDFFLNQQILTSASEKSKYSITKIPPRPTLGSDLGVFTLFTGWLLSVESYPLVIIIGLIGFGLLGAGGSTFIREQSRDEKKALIDDLAGVLIKGFTAAIVIFLGVQGSLAILTTNTGNLNAYALFFVSFVAAVFSDEAWKWAKKRFGIDFNSNESAIANNDQKDNTI